MESRDSRPISRRILQELDVLGRERLARVPRGEHERQPSARSAGPGHGALAPRAGEVERVREFSFVLERRIADDDRAALAADERERLLGAHAAEAERLVREQDPRKDDARARREIERELLELVDGLLRIDDDAPHRPERGDAPRVDEDGVAQRGGRGDRDERDVALVLGEHARDLARRREGELDALVVRQRVPQGARIQISDGCDAELHAATRGKRSPRREDAEGEWGSGHARRVSAIFTRAPRGVCPPCARGP